MAVGSIRPDRFDREAINDYFLSSAIRMAGILSFMTIKLPEEMRQAIQDRDGGPVEVEDDLTHRVYVLVARDDLQRLVDEQLRQDLQIGFDQADAGDVEEWNAGEMLEEAHRRHSLGPNS